MAGNYCGDYTSACDAVPYPYVDADDWSGACTPGGENEACDMASGSSDDPSMMTAGSAVG